MRFATRRITGIMFLGDFSERNDEKQNQVSYGDLRLFECANIHRKNDGGLPVHPLVSSIFPILSLFSGGARVFEVSDHCAALPFPSQCCKSLIISLRMMVMRNCDSDPGS